MQLLQNAGFEIAGTMVVPDEVAEIRSALRASDAGLVVTTGGTGLAARDVTPEATAGLIEREVPGIAEEMRRAGLASTPLAMLSRGLAGVMGQSLVINLPGSVRGATESLGAVLPALGHALELLAGEAGHAPPG